MGREPPSRAGAGEAAGAGAALDVSAGRSGRPRGQGEAAGAVGPDERVQGPPLHQGAAPASGAPRAVVGAPGAAAAPLRRGQGGRGSENCDARPSSDSPKLAKEAGLAPEAPESAAAGLGCPGGCFRPGRSQPRRRGGCALTHSPSARPGVPGPRDGASQVARGPARRGGTASQRRPPPASARRAGPRAPPPHLPPPGAGPPPRSRAPSQGPPARPRAQGSSPCPWEGRERPQSKRRSKEEAKEG